MKAHELFSQIDPELAREIVGYFRNESRDIYKTTLASLAIQRKLRPVFVQKKPADAQIEWLVKTLKLRIGDTVGEHLLQVWLLKGQQALLINFLDQLEIEHDEEGAVENLPDTIDKDKLTAGLDYVLGKYDPRVVTLYLRVFQMQQPGGWPAIADALENDPRLVLTANPAVADAPAEVASEVASAPAEVASAPAEVASAPAEVASAPAEISSEAAPPAEPEPAGAVDAPAEMSAGAEINEGAAS